MSNNYSSCFPHSIPAFTKNIHHSAPDDIVERYATQKASVEKSLDAREICWAKFQVAKDLAEQDGVIQEMKARLKELIKNRPTEITSGSDEAYQTYYTNRCRLEREIGNQIENIDPNINILRIDWTEQTDKSRAEYNSLERLRSAIRLL